MMKKFVFLLISLFAISIAEDIGIEDRPTITNELHRAQEELFWGQEFGEEFLVQNRERLSNYIIIIEEQIVASFMDAYAAIKNTSIETRRIMTEEYPEPSFCKDRVRDRWELQTRRFGQKLSECLGTADSYLKRFTDTLNGLHVESRVYSNVIPNSGIHVLAQNPIYDNKDSLYQFINDRFRDLIFRALDRYTEFNEFVSDIYFDQTEVIRQLTSCFRSYPITFQAASNEDLESIRQCYSD